jgi:hypothetical protein
MGCRTLLLLSLVVLAAPAARAQEPMPGRESGRSFCQQSVSFRLADPARVPKPYRRFVGIWGDGAWDARTCAALIVENVRPNAIASILYIYGPMGPNQPGPGGILHGTGVIRGGALRFEDAKGDEFAFRLGIVDLDGAMTTPHGQSYQSVFKKSF